MTVYVDGWEIYLGVTLRVELRGEVRAVEGQRPSCSGTFAFDLEEEIYGDDIPFYDVRSRVERFRRGRKLIREDNVFSLMPLSTKMTCTSLIAALGVP